MIRYICFSIVLLDILAKIVFPVKIRPPKIIFALRFAISFIYIFTNIELLYTNIFLCILAFIIGYLTYILSCFIVGTKFNKYNLLFINIWKFKGNLRKKYHIEYSQNILKAFLEEIVYRGILQTILGELLNSQIIAAIIVTILFVIMHNLKKMALVQILDLIAFSVIISAIYGAFSDLIMVSIIHITRNWYIINQKYSDYFMEEKRKEKILKIIRRNNHDQSTQI